MNIENLLLFIYESALLKDIDIINDEEGEYMIEYPFGPNIITSSLINQINIFIENTYRENKELFKTIFEDIEIFEEYIIGNYNILDYETIKKFSSSYVGIKGYLELISLTNQESSKLINQLTINFLNYYKETVRIYNEKYTGYKRILQ